ncbi:phage portal protein, partial [Kingella kingae]
AGKVMVLEAGLKYQGITLNPEAAQLLESRAFGIEEICRWFGVPPVLIGHTSASSTWGASIEALFQLFVTTGLRPLLI